MNSPHRVPGPTSVSSASCVCSTRPYALPSGFALSIAKELLLRLGGMNLAPVLSDIDPPRHPDVPMRRNVIEEADEAGGTRRVTHEAHVHAYRHHARMTRALLVEHVEAVADKFEPLARGAGLRHELPVVVRE